MFQVKIDEKGEMYHEGKPIIRAYPSQKRISILCPCGHSCTSIDTGRMFGGSAMEAKLSDPNWTVRCYGTLPKCVAVHNS
jgi:hypothetical protein